jgi:hypothetical protein
MAKLMIDGSEPMKEINPRLGFRVQPKFRSWLAAAENRNLSLVAFQNYDQEVEGNSMHLFLTTVNVSYAFGITSFIFGG